MLFISIEDTRLHLRTETLLKGIVAEQLYCSLHVKELKVTSTELERQAGD